MIYWTSDKNELENVKCRYFREGDELYMANDSLNDKDKLYNYLLLNWDNSVPEFRLWLQKVCGIKTDSELYIDIDYLIKTDDELDEWINCFDGSPDEIFETTEKYKVERFKYVGQTTVSL